MSKSQILDSVVDCKVTTIKLVLKHQLVEVLYQEHDGISSIHIQVVAGERIKSMEDLLSVGIEMSKKLGINPYSKSD